MDKIITGILLVAAAMLVLGGCFDAGDEQEDLSKPGLFNDGDGENYVNSIDEIHLYVESYTEIEPDGVILYRKSNGEKDFQKIDFKYLNSQKEILDDSVVPRETYTYKARAFVKQNGKKFYSPYSDELTISAVNFSGQYDVKTIDSEEDTFVIQVTSKAYNGVTTFGTKMPAKYTVQKDKNSDINVFSAALIGYSKDDQQWQNVPKKGISIKEGESIYLKFKLSSYEGYDENVDPDAEIFFGGSEAAQSTLFSDETDCGDATYSGSGSGITVMTLDLVSGKGKAYCDWDY